MNSHTVVFGLYVPGDSPVHRWPSWLKYLLTFVVGLVPFLIGNFWVSCTALTLVMVLLVVVARLPVRQSLGLPWVFWLMMAVLVGYHVLFTTPTTGLLYLINLLSALYLARMLTMTTRVSDLMDAIATGARPLRLVGADPDRIALAVALMWRSIPYLLGSIADVRDAARARGIERAAWRFIVPVIVNAVGYALATGDAVRARGLDEPAARAQ